MEEQGATSVPVDIFSYLLLIGRGLGPGDILGTM